jgi:hypothetical protein
VEPHPYLILKTLVELGAEDALLVARDGQPLRVEQLRREMLAAEHAPATEAEWHQYAWRLDVSLRYWASLPADSAERAALAPALEAALARLEADDAVLASAAEPRAFDGDRPMGAAKRNKSAIYGHPCGGLHFVQAVLRGVALAGSPALRARAEQQVRLLLARYAAERALYASALQSHPQAALILLAQQLKFFGHLLETLAVAENALGQSAASQLASDVRGAREQAAADLIATVVELRQRNAYAQLAELRAQNPQLRLDLIGDACHAIHGLRETLPVLR